VLCTVKDENGGFMELDILHFFSDMHGTFFDRIVLFITHLGDNGFIWILLSLFFLLMKKYRKAGISMALSLVLSFIVVNITVKNLVMRERPFVTDPTLDNLVYEGSFSFPSGHASASFAAAVSLFIWHKKEGAAALVLAVMIAVSRMYVCVHYPTDVITGALFGTAAALVSAAVVKCIFERFGKKKTEI